MPAQGVDTLQINLEQNLDTEGAKAAGGLEQVAGAFEKVGAAGASAGGLEQKVAGIGAASKAASAELRQQAALEQKIATFDADRAKKIAELKTAYAALNAEATKGSALEQARAASKAAGGKGGESPGLLAAMVGRPTQIAAPNLSGFARLVQLAGDTFGPKGAEAVLGAGKFLSEAGPGLLAAGGALAAAGAVLAAVVVGLGVAVAKLLFAGAKLAIDASTARETAVASFNSKTGGKGEQTYRATMKLAAELGIDPAEAVAQTRLLLQAKLDAESVPLAIRAIADISVDDPSKGNALKEKLAQFGRGKKVDEGAIRGLAEAGVDVNEVFAALAKKGETANQVMARLKANGVSGAEAVKAVLAAVEKTSGGAAAKAAESIPGLVNRIKIGFAGIFDSVDLTPIKEALKSVSAVLEGPVGAELKGALTGLFGQLFHTLFDPFKGPEGQKKLEAVFKTIAEGARIATDLLREAAPYVKAFVELTAGLFGKNYKSSNGLVSSLGAIRDLLVGLATFDTGAIVSSVERLFDLSPIASSAMSSAYGIGTGIVDGVVNGIQSGVSRVISTIMSMAQTAIQTAKTAFDQHSPSKVFESIGANNAAGLAGGHEKGASKVAASVDDMANTGIAAAAPGSAGASGGGAAPVYHFSPVIHVGPGASADVGARVSAALDAAYPQFLSMLRRATRDAAEMAAV